MPDGKKCSKCDAFLPLSFFNIDRHKSDGLRSSCRDCRKGENRRYYEANKDAVLAKNTEWWRNHPDEMAEKNQRFRAANPEYRRAWHEANKQHAAEAQKAWRENNPDKVRAYWQTRRAREAEAFVESIDFAAVCLRDGYICQLCGLPVDLTLREGPDRPSLDHIVPIARGGKHEFTNAQLAHLSCNQRKGASLTYGK